jgi:hypothetical protein
MVDPILKMETEGFSSMLVTAYVVTLPCARRQPSKLVLPMNIMCLMLFCSLVYYNLIYVMLTFFLFFLSSGVIKCFLSSLDVL